MPKRKKKARMPASDLVTIPTDVTLVWHDGKQGLVLEAIADWCRDLDPRDVAILAIQVGANLALLNGHSNVEPLILCEYIRNIPDEDIA